MITRSDIEKIQSISFEKAKRLIGSIFVRKDGRKFKWDGKKYVYLSEKAHQEHVKQQGVVEKPKVEEKKQETKEKSIHQQIDMLMPKIFRQVQKDFGGKAEDWSTISGAEFNDGLCYIFAEIVSENIKNAKYKFAKEDYPDLKFENLNHAFVQIGNKYYDFEARDGVDKPEDLPFFKRQDPLKSTKKINYTKDTGLIKAKKEDPNFDDYREEAESLSKKDSVNIGKYRGDIYNSINYSLRKDQKNSLHSEENQVINSLNKGFKTFKLKKDTTLYRGMSLDKRNSFLLNELKNNEYINLKGIVSTSLDKRVAEVDNNRDEGTDILLTIKCKKGSSFIPLSMFAESRFSKKDYEMDEYVLPHNSKFKIVNRKEVEKNFYEMTLELIEDEEKTA